MRHPGGRSTCAAATPVGAGHLDAGDRERRAENPAPAAGEQCHDQDDAAPPSGAGGGGVPAPLRDSASAAASPARRGGSALGQPGRLRRSRLLLPCQQGQRSRARSSSRRRPRGSGRGRRARTRARAAPATADQDGSNTHLLGGQRHGRGDAGAGRTGHRVLARRVDLHDDHLVGQRRARRRTRPRSRGAACSGAAGTRRRAARRRPPRARR